MLDLLEKIKLELSDIEVKSINKYIKKCILGKFGTIENFADKVGMCPSTVLKYLKGQNAVYTDNFKTKLTLAFNISYTELALTEQQQLAKYVDIIYNNIDLYTEDIDLKLLERLNALCMSNDMTLYTSKMCRNLSKYHFLKNSSIAVHYLSQAIGLIDDMKDTCMILNLRVCYLSELALIYIYEKSYDAAKDALRSIEHMLRDVKILNSIENSNLFWYYYRKGILYNNTAKSSIALDSFRTCLSYKYDDFTEGKALMNIGIALKKLGKYDEAIKYYDEALKKFTNDIDTGILLNNKAEVYRLLGEYSEAKKYIIESFSYILPTDVANNVIVYQTYLQIIKDAGDDINEAIQKLIQMLKQCINNNYFIHRKFISQGIENTINILFSNKDELLIKEFSNHIIDMIRITNDESLKQEFFTWYGMLKFYQQELSVAEREV